MAIKIKKKLLQGMRWCSGAHELWLMVQFHGKFFISCPVEFMNSYNIWIHIYDEFSMNSCIFCIFNIWIHTNMISYKNWIHIFLAVQNKSRECARATSVRRERPSRAASAQCEPQGQSPSSPPAPTRPRWLPRPLGLRAAAPIVRVACGCPDS